jgi:probable F420-dependent oxidoreductase
MISHTSLADPDFVSGLCDALEKLEFGTVWLTDHIVRPREYDSTYPYSDTGKMRGDIVAEPLTTLAFMAARTERLALGTAVLILPQRNPILVAKQTATVDRLSGGRLRLGVGVGWLEEEFRLLGAEFSGRGARTDAYLEILQALWTQEYPVIEAAGIKLDGGVDLVPKPASPKGIPIVLGGHSKAAVRRAARFGQAFFPMGTEPDSFEEVFAALEVAVAAAGRAPGDVELIVPWVPVSGWVERMRERGVSELVMNTDPAWSLDELVERLEKFQSRVGAA